MPIVFLSPSTQDWTPYVTGSGSEEYWMNRIVDAMEPYLRSNGIRYRRNDLLTMSEIIQCVADMRTQDVKAIREFGKFIPAFAAFEKNRLNLYREAAKEAEEIFDRWADEIDNLDEDFMEDEDYEPDEYYSD